MRELKNDYSMLWYLVVGYFTLGIYYYYYMFCFVRDLNELCGDDGKWTPNVFLQLFLSIITLGVYDFYYWGGIYDRLRNQARKYDDLYEISGNKNVVIWFIGGIIFEPLAWYGMYQCFEAYNELASRHNRKNGYHC